MYNNYNPYYYYQNMPRAIPNYAYQNMPQNKGLLSRLFNQKNTRDITNAIPQVASIGSSRDLLGLGTGAASLGSEALGASAATHGFSFTNFLNGASKTLGVINQAIPVFYQVKPIINNAKTIFRVAKAMNSNEDNQVTNNSLNKESIVKEEKNENNSSIKNNSPNFFQ